MSSIQPIEITPALIDAFASHPNLCPHLHLSCQSGDDTVLKAMNRPYDTEFFERLVENLRNRIPDLAITTDLIVGYPGETREMHENTLSLRPAGRASRRRTASAIRPETKPSPPPSPTM